MGKTSKWIKNLLTGKKDKAQSPPISTSPVPPKEKRRWSFRRPSATTAAAAAANSTDLVSAKPPSPLAVENEPAKKHATAVVTVADATAHGGVRTEEDLAATKIQSVFRSYLARTALSALKGLVKLQALVRGHLVRKQAMATLRCMQALVTVQARARAQRIRINGETLSPYELMEDKIKIVEMDVGHISPTPSAPSPRALMRHFHDSSFEAALSSPQNPSSAVSKSDRSRADYSESVYEFPNYMANTQSSKAKVRSQSAPKQRPVEYNAAGYERQPSWSKRRNVARGVKMQRSSSHLGQNYPWSVKLDKSTVSMIESECGSTSTILTNSNSNYARSLFGVDVHANRY